MRHGYLQLGFDQSTRGFKTNRRLGVSGGVLTEFSGKHIQSNTEANAFVCPVGLSEPSQQIESGRMEWTNVFWLWDECERCGLAWGSASGLPGLSITWRKRWPNSTTMTPNNEDIHKNALQHLKKKILPWVSNPGQMAQVPI